MKTNPSAIDVRNAINPVTREKLLEMGISVELLDSVGDMEPSEGVLAVQAHMEKIRVYRNFVQISIFDHIKKILPDILYVQESKGTDIHLNKSSVKLPTHDKNGKPVDLDVHNMFPGLGNMKALDENPGAFREYILNNDVIHSYPKGHQEEQS